MRIRRREQWWAAATDLALVIVFVLIGRASHDAETPLVTTLWPFVAGLTAGWLVTRAWRAPTTLRTGVPLAAITIAVGIVLRAATGQGVQLSFIIVTTVVLAAFLLGWRAIA
ncbi:DUF3054 domain-containing protein, partial [Salmonella enterica]|uniref:DUF3054 domain-containing protein n=1 Tax=Salmonella enterica TaxID=28901 RepID=UPI000A3A8BB8